MGKHTHKFCLSKRQREMMQSATALYYAVIILVLVFKYRLANSTVPLDIPKPPWPLHRGQGLPAWATREIRRTPTRLRGSAPPEHPIAGKSIGCIPFMSACWCWFVQAGYTRPLLHIFQFSCHDPCSEKGSCLFVKHIPCMSAYCLFGLLHNAILRGASR